MILINMFKSWIGNIENFGLKAGTLNYLGSLHRTIATKYFRSYADWIISKRQGTCAGCENVCCYTSHTGEICEHQKNGECQVYHQRIDIGKEN